MLRGIIGTSLGFRFLVITLAAVVMLVGVTRLGDMPVDVLPEFSPPYVEIQTEALGLSAEEVEQLITVPMEQDLLNGVAWLDVIRSESVPGLSSVTLIFEPGTDLYRARQMVAERLSQAAVGLPHVSKPPTMLQPTSATGRVMIVGLSSKTLSMIQMSVLARWTIGPRLMGVPGVANVAIWGQRERQLQVQVDPEWLRAHDVSLLQVLETTGNALWVSSLSFVEASTPGSAGFIDTPQQRLGIRHILPIVSPEGLAQVPVQDAPGVRLSDVANVVENHQPLIGDAMTNDGTSLLLVIEKFPGSNTLEVTRGVEGALAAMRPGLPGIEINSTIYRPANFIEMARDNLARALIIGCVLLALILGIFFFNWRTALISIIVIPLSLAAAGLVLYLRGATLNVMVLAGLMVAGGIIVDEAIIDVEHVKRRLQQHRKEGSARPAASILLDAALEVRSTIFFATMVLLLAVAPLFALGGVSGAFFQPFAVSYALAVVSSMVVALTVTPVLCAIFLSDAPLERRTPPLVGWFQHVSDQVLGQIVQRPRLAYLTLAAIMICGLGVLPFFRQEALLPAFKEPDLLIQLEGAPGTSHPAMVRMVDQASRELRAIPGVRDVGAHVGRAIFGDQVVGINSAELWVNVDPTIHYGATVEAVRETMSDYPGLVSNVQGYLQGTFKQVLTGSSNSIVVRIFGDNPEVLRGKAEEVRQVLAGVAGIVDSHTDLAAEEPSLQIEVDLAQAQRYGIKPGDVRRAAATLLSGIQVGSLFEEQKVFEVVVWSTPETRSSLTSIRDLLIDTPTGERVRLGDVAEVRVVPAPNVIRHQGTSSYLDVSANVQGRDLGAVAADVQSRLQQVQFPFEYHPEVLGEYAERQAAQNRLFGFGIAAVIGMIVVLQAALGSWRLAAAVFLALFPVLAGGVLAAFAWDQVVSFGSLVGLLMVFGIAARNSILLINHYQRLQQVEGVPFGPELVLRGTRERIGPILTTAFGVGLAFVSALVWGDQPGFEIVSPMAAVILGSLVTATLLNLFVVPALYLRLGSSQVEDLGVVPVTGAAQERMLSGMGAGK